MSVEPAVRKTVPTDYVGHAANVQTDTSNRRGCRTAGSTGNRVVQLLVQSGLLVRALVHQVDERSERLQKLGAEVLADDLMDPDLVRKAMQGIKRAYFHLSGCRWPAGGNRVLRNGRARCQYRIGGQTCRTTLRLVIVRRCPDHAVLFVVLLDQTIKVKAARSAEKRAMAEHAEVRTSATESCKTTTTMRSEKIYGDTTRQDHYGFRCSSDQ